jgi:hypothetical protein
VEHRVCPCDLLTLIYLLGSSCTGPCDGTSPVCAPSPPTATCPLLRARSHRLTPNGAVDARGDAKEQPPAPRGHTAERATWRGRGRAAVSAVGHDRRQPRVAFGRGVRDERIQRGRACLERDGIGHAWRGKYSGDEKVRLTRCTIPRCPPAGSPQHEGAVYGYTTDFLLYILSYLAAPPPSTRRAWPAATRTGCSPRAAACRARPCTRRLPSRFPPPRCTLRRM